MVVFVKSFEEKVCDDCGLLSVLFWSFCIDRLRWVEGLFNLIVFFCW